MSTPQLTLPPRGSHVYFGETFIHVARGPEAEYGTSVTFNDLWQGPRGGYGRMTPRPDWLLLKALLFETKWAVISVYSGTRHSADKATSPLWPADHPTFAATLEAGGGVFVVGCYLQRVGHWRRVVMENCPADVKVTIFDRDGPVTLTQEAVRAADA